MAIDEIVNMSRQKTGLTPANVNNIMINVNGAMGGVTLQYWSELIKIIEGASKLNIEKVLNYSRLLVEKLRADGNERIAERIEQVLSETNTSPRLKAASVGSDSNTRIPFDQDSRLPVADVFPAASCATAVILNRENEEVVSRFLAYVKKSEALVEAGLSLPHALMLYGPPGCGKTILAKHIAHELGLPLVLARLDSLISSYLGSTAKNIRHLFEYANTHPCILFLDEFDAIAKMRDDGHELGELKRVVNSLLQNIDSIGNESILIAATNHEHMLDPAVWRRFTFSLEMSNPNEESRAKMIELFLRNSLTDEKSIKVLVRLFDGLSGATIESICLLALRDAVLEGMNAPLLSHVCSAFFIQSNLPQAKARTDQVRYLRTLDPKFFSFGVIGTLFGHSRQWAQQQYSRGAGVVDGETIIAD